MLDHDQANDRAWDRLLEHLDTDVATADDFAHFDAAPPAPMPEGKVAAIVARATGSHRRKSRAVAGVMLAAATVLLTVLIAGVTSHSSPSAPVITPTLTPAKALQILHDPIRVKGDYASAMARTVDTARGSINWLRATALSREAKPEVVRRAKLRTLGLLHMFAGTQPQDPPVLPTNFSLPANNGSITGDDVDRVADVACYATSSLAGFVTSDSQLVMTRDVYLQKIHKWVWMSATLGILYVAV
jgi:hypothetical protein